MKFNNIIKGTITLIIAGLLTKALGFYYRIFLSAKIGAEGIGIYQMIFPLYTLCLSLSAYGVMTTISRFVSRSEVPSMKPLFAGLAISLPIALLCSLGLYLGCDVISAFYLNEPRCSTLIRYSAIALPFEAIHCCIGGYFLGQKNAFIPGLTQFLEQLSRVVAVWLAFYLFEDKISHSTISLAMVAVIGLIIGEFVSTIVSIIAAIINRIKRIKNIKKSDYTSITMLIKPIALMAFPLTMTALILSLVHSIEAITIPYFLRLYGLTAAEAISIYGILTAMALPFILFPTTISGAVSKMLLPTIASAQAKNNKELIAKLSTNTIKYSISFGMFCTCFFLLTGNIIGKYIYHNSIAGNYISTLSWLCPFMFTSTTLGSILHGLGLTKKTFYQNVISAIARLFFILFAVPHYGIKGYLIGLLISECLCATLHTISITKYINSQQLHITN